MRKFTHRHVQAQAHTNNIVIVMKGEGGINMSHQREDVWGFCSVDTAEKVTLFNNSVDIP